jgi:DNA polymerase-3 subunit delta'
MIVSNYVKQHQPHLYTLFSHALTNQKWSHAYLLSGQRGMPLKEMALYLAQSLVCEHGSPLADESCTTCQRIIQGDFADLKFMDGANGSIKKQDVLDLEQSFSISSLEIFQRQIYVLHLVENMTPEAVNALLKFLEEPQQEIYAILTTETIHALLPTITSRSQVVRLLPLDQQAFIDQLIAQGASPTDATLASFFHTTPEQALGWITSSFYQQIKKPTLEWFLLFGKKTSHVRLFFRQMILPLLSTEADVQQWFQLFIIMVEQSLRLSHHEKVLLKNERSALLLINDSLLTVQESIELTQDTMHRLRLPVNIPLLLDQWLIRFTKGMRIL